MKIKLQLSIPVIFSLTIMGCCLSLEERRKTDFGILGTAVTYVSDKVIGRYGDVLPDDFDTTRFVAIAKEELVVSQYNILTRYRLEIISKQAYYLLKIYDKDKLVMFDYSCTPKLDGPILYSDKTFDLEHLEIYDECKKTDKKKIAEKNPFLGQNIANIDQEKDKSVLEKQNYYFF